MESGEYRLEKWHWAAGLKGTTDRKRKGKKRKGSGEYGDRKGGKTQGGRPDNKGDGDRPR